ncbi:hypothetical protein KAX03_02505 [Candidatus Bathyarchaeota archaeon]|nr:hypothetical protein [Candidatus Bathyarchaeota archaeon]
MNEPPVRILCDLSACAPVFVKLIHAGGVTSGKLFFMYYATLRSRRQVEHRKTLVQQILPSGVYLFTNLESHI